MKPIKFKEANAAFVNIDGHVTPVFKSDCNRAVIVACHKLGFWERLYVLFWGKIWFSQATHTANPKPYRLTVNKHRVLARIEIKEEAVNEEKAHSKPKTPPPDKKGLTKENLIK